MTYPVDIHPAGKGEPRLEPRPAIWISTEPVVGSLIDVYPRPRLQGGAVTDPTGDWPEVEDANALQRVARAVGLSWDEWKAVEPRLPTRRERVPMLLNSISAAARSRTVLLCFDNIVILQYEGHLSISDSLMHCGKQRIRGKNEVVDPSANLTCEEARSLFVMLEALVYQIVHIELEQQRANYSQSSERYEARLDRLVAAGLLDASMRVLGLEIYGTRNQFAHSLLPVKEILYLSEPLDDRWGANGVSGQRKFKRYFLPDVYTYSEALLAIFRLIQHRQLDPDRFRNALTGSPLPEGMGGQSHPVAVALSAPPTEANILKRQQTGAPVEQGVPLPATVVIDGTASPKSKHADALQRVAREVGISWPEWQRLKPMLPAPRHRMHVLFDLIKCSARSPTVLFCLDDIVVLRHDGYFSGTASIRLPGDEHILARNEVVNPSATLGYEEVRSIFVMLEALVYKIVHVEFEGQRANYSQRAVSYEARLDRMVEQGLMSAHMRTLALEIHDTRNQFAHSLQSIRDITYLSAPLKDRWDSTDAPDQRCFLPDVYKYSEALLTRFRPLQHQQLDPVQFRATLNDLLADVHEVDAAGEH